MKIVPKKNKEGYQFLGWYFNDTKYYFDLPVEKDMIILAKLKKVIVSETSNDEHGYYCRSGYKLNKDKCTKTYSIRATLQHICPVGSEYEGKGICFETSTETIADQVACGKGEITQNTGSVIRCYYDETELDESECSKNSWYFYNGVCYYSYRSPSCKNGKSTTIGYRSGKEVYYCGGKHSMAKAAYTCPLGYNLNNTMCYKTETINANYK